MNRAVCAGRVVAIIVVANVVVASVVVAGAATAGTSGGIYDMRALLNEPHPFAAATAPAQATRGPAAPPRRETAPRPAPPPVIRTSPRAADIEPSAGPPATPGSRRVAQTAAPQGGSVPWLAPHGFYVSFGGGFDGPEDLSGHTATGQSFTTEMNGGYAFTGAFGSYFSRGVRAELELATRHADYDRTVIGATRRGGGDLSVTTFMANVYYDVDVGWLLVPYFGGGIGVALLDGADVVVAGQTVPGRDSSEFAFQGIIGATYWFTPRWSLGIDARYLGTGDDDASSVGVGINARFNL